MRQHLQQPDLSLTPRATFDFGATGLVRLLIDHRLLGAGELLDGEVRLQDASRRNRSVIVTRADGTGFVVKEGDTRRERDQYRALAEIPDLADFVPDLRNGLGETLVLGAEPGALDLYQFQMEGGAIGVEIGAAVGRALAILHRASPLGMRGPADAAPDIFEITLPDTESLRAYSAGALELIRTIQGHATLGAKIEAAGRDWSDEAVIHGDVKWPNILVVPSSIHGPPGIRLIDWEHSGGGDPGWDVGSALAGYLSCWIVSMPAGRGRAIHETVRAARVPLDDLRPSIAGLWREYSEWAGLSVEPFRRLRRRSTVLCAVRLIKTAFEDSVMRTTMSIAAARHLQLAANVLDDPEDAATRLLALGA